jgi:hypothetical protein
MMPATAFPETAVASPLDADRLGVLASVLCAIHCAVTPLLLLILPSFGRVWAHPTSHWGMALLVIPVAAIVTTLGGIALIITHLGNLCACRSCHHAP